MKEINSGIFRAYDIRGLVGRDLDEDFAEELPEINLTEQEATIVNAVLVELRKANTPEEYQGVAFNAAKANNWKPRDVFPVVYRVLLGKTQGPRLGPYISLIGKEGVISEMENAVKKRA